MAFLYSFVNFMQPGILIPDLAKFKPALAISIVALIGILFQKERSLATFSLKHKITVCILLFLFVQVLSVYYSGLASVTEMFSFWYKYAIYFVVSVLLITNETNLRRYIWGMMLGSCFVIFYGIYAVHAHLPSSVVIGGKAGAYGMYENHNDYTFIIIQNLPFMIYFWRDANTTGHALRKFILSIMILSCFYGVVLSQSRGGMIALVFEVGALLWFLVPRKKRVSYLFVFTIIGIGAIYYQFSIRAESSGEDYTAEDSKSSRFELWEAGWNMFKAHPLLGIGSTRFSEYAREYGDLSRDQYGKNAHNTYIEILAGTGILGILFFLRYVTLCLSVVNPNKVSTSPKMLALCVASYVALLSILARAFFDAKVYDWSFYTLGAICLSLFSLMTHLSSQNIEVPEGTSTNV